MKNKNILATIAIFFIMLSSIAVLAGIGETSGLLDFGKVQRNGQETRSYGVINTDPTPMPVVGEISGNLSNVATFVPKRFTIPASGTRQVQVTVRMPKNAIAGQIYTGSITFVSDSESAGLKGGTGVGVKLGVLKKARATVSAEVKPGISLPLPLVFGAIIAAVAISILLIKYNKKLFKKKIVVSGGSVPSL